MDSAKAVASCARGHEEVLFLPKAMDYDSDSSEVQRCKTFDSQARAASVSSRVFRGNLRLAGVWGANIDVYSEISHLALPGRLRWRRRPRRNGLTQRLFSELR